MSNDSESILSQRSIQEMVMVANEFCHLTETVETQSQEVFMNVMQKMMPLLYLKGSLLPIVSVSNLDANMIFITEEDWNHIFVAVKDKIGAKDDFLFHNDNDIEDKIERCSIAEEIADIYQDMKDCLKLLQMNTKDAQENAISELQKHFTNHWGIKVCKVQYALHNLLYR